MHLKLFFELVTKITLLITLIPLVSFFLTGKIIDQIQKRIAWAFGNQVMFFLAGLGIVAHETGHLVVAKLFGHKIQSVRFLQKGPDGRYGYVEHSWNKKNWFQNLGNFFIGSAPIIFISLLLIALIWIGAMLGTKFPLLYAVLAYLGLSLVLGMNLSKSDWQSILRATPLIIVVIFIATILCLVLKADDKLITLLASWVSIFSLSIFLTSFSLWILISIITHFFHRH